MDLAVITVTIGIALVGTLIAIWWRLGMVGNAVKELTRRVDDDQKERLRLWQRVDDHETRLTRVEVKQEQ